MIRQAINCDMCGAEKLESASHWFVAEEQGGELKLRAWLGSAKSARKNMKHVCGQKCVQRLMDNFTASILTGLAKTKDVVSEKAEQIAQQEQDQEEMPILERMGYDRETAAQIEADSWAGPARPKENSWGASTRKAEGESFINAIRAKSQAARAYQRPA
jgi:hypothetical protein